MRCMQLGQSAALLAGRCAELLRARLGWCTCASRKTSYTCSLYYHVMLSSAKQCLSIVRSTSAGQITDMAHGLAACGHARHRGSHGVQTLLTLHPKVGLPDM